MIAIAVDDEALMLGALVERLKHPQTLQRLINFPIVKRRLNLLKNTR